MSLPRFFIKHTLSQHQEVSLSTEQTHHAMRVLRLKNHAQVALFNGEPNEYRGPIEFQKNSATVKLETQHTLTTELPHQIILFQGIPSGDKMDWIIEKATELGVSSIIPINAQRSILKLQGERLTKRLEHWRRVAQSAAEQSGRYRVPSIETPLSLHDALHKYSPEFDLLACHPEQTNDIYSLPYPTKPLGLLIGPEGGWTELELQRVAQQKITKIALGARILRTETAGLAITVALCAHFKWL